MNWLDDIRREDLPECYQEMLDVIAPVVDEGKAIEIILKLSSHYKHNFYFISTKGIISARKEKYVIDHFNGSNQTDLARITDLSLVRVYQILAEDREKKQPKLFPQAFNNS